MNVDGLGVFLRKEIENQTTNTTLNEAKDELDKARSESNSIHKKINDTLAELRININNSTYQPRTEGKLLKIRNYVNKKIHESQRRTIQNKINKLQKELNKMFVKPGKEGPNNVIEAQRIVKKLDVLLKDSRVSKMTNRSIDDVAIFQELNIKIANMWINIHESAKKLTEIEKSPKKHKPMTEKKQQAVEASALAKARKIGISTLEAQVKKNKM